MGFRYEYNSTCCNHLYIESRKAEDPQVITKCNVCGNGEYEEIKRTEFEDMPEPVYSSSEETTDTITEPES